MANKPCIARLQKEYKLLLKVRGHLRIQRSDLAGNGVAEQSVLCCAQEPVPNITAHPSPSNILEWHYALEGPADTEYAGAQALA